MAPPRGHLVETHWRRLLIVPHYFAGVVDEQRRSVVVCVQVQYWVQVTCVVAALRAQYTITLVAYVKIE